MTFTPEQEAIFSFVETGSGHGIIDAVAGAGKTTTIMECARFVKDQSEVLFCAFNASIAREIGQKFQARGLHQVTVKTIHALGRKMLLSRTGRDGNLQLDNKKYNAILKGEEFQQEVKIYYERLIRINGFNPDQLTNDRQRFAINNLLYRINQRLLNINQKYRSTLCKDTIEDFSELLDHFGIFSSRAQQHKKHEERVRAYYECHQQLLEAGNKLAEDRLIIDYTDMIYLPFKWQLSPPKKFKFLFIDECQDLSKAQFAVAAKYGDRQGRILAVGDPYQSIYGFTGADIESFERVKIYTKATQLPLTVCFRCPQAIIAMASEIREDIVGNKKVAGTVTTITGEEITKLAQPGDLIISRIKAPLVLLVFEFIDKDIPVQIHEDEAQDFINELKSLFKQPELNARLDRQTGAFTALKGKVRNRWEWIIDKQAQRISDPVERDLYIINENNYVEKRLEFLHKKAEIWRADCPTIFAILKKIKQFISAKHKQVRLSSIHRAKGLEENRVFIVDYDKLPYVQMEQQDWERTQELNLKYVAITRAKEQLFLVEAVQVQEKADEGSLFDDFPF
jgi:superfamily I DNA/RNA helicase